MNIEQCMLLEYKKKSYLAKGFAEVWWIVS